MPEEYRKQTLGYLAREEPRTVLALPEDFTEAQLKAAYRAAVKRTRPDLGGDYEEFLRIQAAYEALTQPLSVGAMLKAAHRGSTT
jgi:curved DNA-binding protein CbpA